MALPTASRSVLFVVLAACNQDAKAPIDARPAPTSSDATRDATSDATSGSSAPTASATFPLSGIVITNLSPGRFEVSNKGPAPVKLKTSASIERQDSGGGFQAIESRFDVGKGYRLIEQCVATEPPCVEIPASGKLYPVRWSGFNCSAQCNGTCRANSFEGPGTFRLVVTQCEGDAQVAGPTFELPELAKLK